MQEIGRGKVTAEALNSLHSHQFVGNKFLSQEVIDSLRDGWDERKPAKVYLCRGRAVELMDGCHRSAYFVLIGKPDYMVPVVFYTDD